MSQAARLQKVAAVIAGLVVCMVMALCLTGCAGPLLALRAEKLPHYGAAVPGTIQVTVLRGFKRPGHYHLPKDATLGQLLDLAKLKPFKWGTNNPQYWQYLEINIPHTDKGHLTIHRGGEAGLTFSAKARNLHLQDGQRVRCWCVTF